MTVADTCPTCGRHHTVDQLCLIGVLLGCGGRQYSNWARVLVRLDAMALRMVITAVRHGCAPGADSLIDRWARFRKHTVEPMLANWREHGRYKAGPIRNSAMLARDPAPVACVAFPGGNGTADMVAKCEAAGIPVLRVDWS